jgi:hypothetical protein
VTINSKVQTGQSTTLPPVTVDPPDTRNTAVNNKITFADTVAGTNPQDKIDSRTAGKNGGALRFPSETPRYYMSLAYADYHRQSWREVGTLNEKGRFILPLPTQMIDNQHVMYDTVSIGAVGAAGVSSWCTFQVGGLAGLSIAAVIAFNPLAKGNLEKFGSVATAAAARAMGNLGKGITSIIGLSVNDFMTVMMKGPSYKEREFIWRFSPQSADESETLKKIIQITNNESAPALDTGLGSLFFKWPSIWNLKFEHVDRDLSLQTFVIKPAVLVNVTWNYTPNGVPAFYAGSSAPESIECRMNFMELEYWLKGDYK